MLPQQADDCRILFCSSHRYFLQWKQSGCWRKRSQYLKLFLLYYNNAVESIVALNRRKMPRAVCPPLPILRDQEQVQRGHGRVAILGAPAAAKRMFPAPASGELALKPLRLPGVTPTDILFHSSHLVGSLPGEKMSIFFFGAEL